MFLESSGGVDARTHAPSSDRKPCRKCEQSLMSMLSGCARTSQQISLDFERLPRVYLAQVGSHPQFLATLDHALGLRSGWTTSVSEPIPSTR